MASKPETRTEYRVVGENFRGELFVSELIFRRQDEAEANLHPRRAGGALNGRIQQRTVTETPWEDVTDGE